MAISIHIPAMLEKNLLVAQLCLTLFDPMDHSLPGSSLQGILQTRILEWAAIPLSGDLPNTGIKPGAISATCMHMCPPS